MGFSGLNTKPAVPNHSINQSGFPNIFFGLAAMNEPRKSISSDTCTSHMFRKYFNFFSPSSKYIYDIPMFQLLPLPFYPVVVASRNVFDRCNNFRQRHFPGDNNLQRPMSWLSDRLAVLQPIRDEIETLSRILKVHKIENFFGFNFEICTFS